MRARRQMHELPLEDVLLLPSLRRNRPTAPPRVRLCLPWWQIVVVVVCMYGVALYFVCQRVFVPSEKNAVQDYVSWRGTPLQATRTTPVLTAEQVEQLQTMQSEVARKLQVSSAQSCRLLQKDIKFSTSSCPAGKEIVYWNPMKRERYLCGHKIEAESALQLPAECPGLTATVFPVTPDRSGLGMPSVDLRFDSSAQLEEFECDIPCRTAGFNIAHSRKVLPIDGGKGWTITFSMEGVEYYPYLEIKDDAYKSDHFYATTSFESEIPLPYFSFAEYNIQSPPVHFDEAIKGAVFMARNCASKNDRETLVKEFINHTAVFRMDSLSMCLQNAKPDPSWDMDNKTEIMRRYLFYLAFENQNTDDYVTEKLWGALAAGTLPIYYGAPNVQDHAPEHSIIHVRDFESVEKLMEYLIKVANDRALYESYHAWRFQPLPAEFLEKYNFVHTHSTCRTCRWAYARMYGLGWDHKTQQIRELHIPRQVCVAPQGMIQRPFRETWNGVDQKPAGPCTTINAEIMSKTIDTHLERTVRDRDGVIDIYIDRAQDSTMDTIQSFMVLETQLAPSATLHKVESKHYRMQDDKSRYTFLLQTSSLLLGKESLVVNKNKSTSVTLEITEQMLPIHLRIIVEDLDLFHKGADQEENFFAQLMKEDFLHPLEAFVIP